MIHFRIAYTFLFFFLQFISLRTIYFQTLLRELIEISINYYEEKYSTLVILISLEDVRDRIIRKLEKHLRFLPARQTSSINPGDS